MQICIKKKIIMTIITTIIKLIILIKLIKKGWILISKTLMLREGCIETPSEKMLCGMTTGWCNS